MGVVLILTSERTRTAAAGGTVRRLSPSPRGARPAGRPALLSSPPIEKKKKTKKKCAQAATFRWPCAHDRGSRTSKLAAKKAAGQVVGLKNGRPGQGRRSSGDLRDVVRDRGPLISGSKSSAPPAPGRRKSPGSGS